MLSSKLVLLLLLLLLLLLVLHDVYIITHNVSNWV
jgi:hypothetical protein